MEPEQGWPCPNVGTSNGNLRTIGNRFAHSSRILRRLNREGKLAPFDLLTRGSFTSVADLETKVLAFIDYYNRTMAKPFKWTYQGKALTI
jgi:hypothetical protein